MGVDNKHGDRHLQFNNTNKKKKNKSLKNEKSQEQKAILTPVEKKKRKHSANNDADADADVVRPDENSVERKGDKKKRKISRKKKLSGNDGVSVEEKHDSQKAEPKYKTERGGKKKKKDHKSVEGINGQIKEESQTVANQVYRISGVDVDSSKGMKKWINEYHQNRPGLKVLQERIDDFITSHEEKEEQVKKEREALAAEGGWTVVEHHKGRKKTVDSESGTTVVSVAGAAVVDKMGKKKSKDVGVDFYRFQKREAQRNEIIMLQGKFEQDKKRIQQLRAARKFRPY